MMGKDILFYFLPRIFFLIFESTLPETNMAPETRPSLKETNLPTIIISGASC